MKVGATSTIGEVTSIVTKGTTPTTLGRQFVSHGIGFIKAECISNDGALIVEKQVYIDEETDQLLKRSRLQKDDVLFSIAGVIGRTAIVQQSALPANTNQAIAILRPDPKLITPKFLYYSVRAKEFQDHSLGHVVQTAQANVSLGVLTAAPIWLPPLATQHRIAGILSAYDELIENSQQRIKILESMARALYREWFVYLRFPGHESVPLVPSALGDIPQGWEVKRIDEAFQTVLGGTPSRTNTEFWDGGSIPWINSGKVNDLRITEASEMITSLALERSAAKLMPLGTTVLAITGATLGQVSYLEIETTANQSVVGIMDPTGELSEWVYLMISDRIESIINHASGGAQQHINKENVNSVQVSIPSRSLSSDFKAVVSPMFREIATLLFQIQNLRRTRDLLLPRLLSGQINVEDAA
jgi:type I restriction enzyme S subunit